jgi:transcriptional regulator with XRE-family HTH domain
MQAEEAALAKVLSERIKEFRHRRGLTQADLAYAIDLTPHYIALLETARKLPTLRALLAIASALGTTVGELLSSPAEGDWPDRIAKLVARIPPEGQPLVEKVVAVLVDETKPPTRGKRRK